MHLYFTTTNQNKELWDVIEMLAYRRSTISFRALACAVQHRVQRRRSTPEKWVRTSPGIRLPHLQRLVPGRERGERRRTMLQRLFPQLGLLFWKQRQLILLKQQTFLKFRTGRARSKCPSIDFRCIATWLCTACPPSWPNEPIHPVWCSGQFRAAWHSSSCADSYSRTTWTNINQ